jgi:hypothetical protein
VDIRRFRGQHACDAECSRGAAACESPTRSGRQQARRHDLRCVSRRTSYEACRKVSPRGPPSP